MAITQRGRHRYRPMDPIWKMSAAVQPRSSDVMDIKPSLAGGNKSGGKSGFNLREEVGSGRELPIYLVIFKSHTIIIGMSRVNSGHFNKSTDHRNSWEETLLRFLMISRDARNI